MSESSEYFVVAISQMGGYHAAGIVHTYLISALGDRRLALCRGKHDHQSSESNGSLHRDEILKLWIERSKRKVSKGHNEGQENCRRSRMLDQFFIRGSSLLCSLQHNMPLVNRVLFDGSILLRHCFPQGLAYCEEA
jgi:hypothetical protein